MKLNIIDLQFLQSSQVIAAFLIQEGTRNILVETGPASTLKTLNEALSQYGLQPEDITDVLLTHIHFDHAGAAWYFASKGAHVYVHPLGYPHLSHPEKLLASARRIYKAKMDELWGDIHAIPEDKLTAIEDREELQLGTLKWIAHHTPGHAKHHIAWQLGDLLFTGDVAGVSLQGRAVVPPCPPPDIDLEDWDRSIQRIRELELQKLLLTHFGEVTDIEAHLSKLSDELQYWADWIRENGIEKNPEIVIPEFVMMTEERLKKQGLEKYWIERYHKANPPEMSVTGLQRYWSKKKVKED
ncbi:MAG TPA: MBL fold metallo-hydrolase [Saprospiraceae bacterium]|nr:MBL fold metallo-hydrolase [Saprospiraceae bacterium]